MCRADIAPEAHGLLGRILGDMAQQLAEEFDVPAESVLIGPVDFGAEEVDPR